MGTHGGRGRTSRPKAKPQTTPQSAPSPVAKVVNRPYKRLRATSPSEPESGQSAEALVAAMGPPQLTGPAVTLDGAEFDFDALEPYPHTTMPLPQQPLGLLGDLVVEAPRVSDGMVAIRKVATAIGWPSDALANFRLFPNARAVVLRPTDTVTEADPWRTLAGADHGEVSIDDKGRIRLPAGILVALGVRPDGDQILVWAYRRVGTRQPMGSPKPSTDKPWAMLLMHPRSAMPQGWDEWVEW